MGFLRYVVCGKKIVSISVKKTNVCRYNASINIEQISSRNCDVNVNGFKILHIYENGLF